MRFVVNILTSFRCDVAALRFLPFLDPLVQGLKHPRVHRRNDIHRRIQLLFGHPRFPCVRKAPLHSRVAEAHHCHGEADEHFLPVGEAFHGVGVTIERTKVGFLHRLLSLMRFASSPMSGVFPGHLKPGPETRDSRPAWSFRLHATDQRIRKAAFNVHMIVVFMPCEIIFLQPLREFRRFPFQLFRRF